MLFNTIEYIIKFKKKEEKKRKEKTRLLQTSFKL